MLVHLAVVLSHVLFPIAQDDIPETWRDITEVVKAKTSEQVKSGTYPKITKGVLVTKMQLGTATSKLIGRRAVILRANNKPMNSEKTWNRFYDSLKPGDEVELEIANVIGGRWKERTINLKVRSYRDGLLELFDVAKRDVDNQLVATAKVDFHFRPNKTVVFQPIVPEVVVNRATNSVELRAIIQYAGNDWFFAESIKCSADGRVFDLGKHSFDRKVRSSMLVVERIVLKGPEITQLLETIATTDNYAVQFENETRKAEFESSSKAIQNAVTLAKLLKK